MELLIHFAESRPWWTFVYLVVVGATLNGIAQGLGGRRR